MYQEPLALRTSEMTLLSILDVINRLNFEVSFSEILEGEIRERLFIEYNFIYNYILIIHLRISYIHRKLRGFSEGRRRNHRKLRGFARGFSKASREASRGLCLNYVLNC